MIVAGTGHRELKHSEAEVRRLVQNSLRDCGATHFICGMASGFDLIAGTTALRLGISVTAAKPWRGHMPHLSDRALYAEVIESAVDVVNVINQENYPGPWCYHARNEWMVDHSDRMLAYWSGLEKGGTFACIKYANKKNSFVRNIYAEKQSVRIF